MSKPKKRKPNQDAQQKLQQAGSINEYKRRIKALCVQLGFESKLKLLERDLELVYKIRPKMIRVVAVDKKVPEEFVSHIRSHIDYCLKHLKTAAYEGGPEVSWDDYRQLVEPLRLYLDVRAETNHPVAVAFADILKKPKKQEELNIIVELAERVEMLGMSESNFIEYFFHIQATFGHTSNGKSMRETLLVEVRSEPPSWKQIRIGAGKRVAARMGFSFPKATEWMQVRPSQLGIRRRVADNSPMEVYMLKHAAQRLYQRIGGKFRDLMNMDMIASLLDLRAFPTGAGNFLIEHRVSDIKVGYYAATITDGVLLIRTFLLITQSGTPEGRKLAELTGLSKLDHQYMAFDSLPALASSDLLQNEEIQQMFVEAGCGGLMTICDKMRQKSAYYHLLDKPNMVADKLLQYIKQGKEEVSDLWTDEPETEELTPPVSALCEEVHPDADEYQRDSGDHHG